MEAKCQLSVAIMVSHLLVVGLIATVSTASVNMETAVIDNLGSPHPHAMVYLGAVGEKTFFAEAVTKMAYAAAAAYCQAARLQVASIETQAEADFLNQTIHELELANQVYWTSGKHTLLPSSFSWNETETEVNGSLFTNWVVSGAGYYCLGFYPSAAGTTTLYSYPCTTATLSTLCQA